MFGFFRLLVALLVLGGSLLTVVPAPTAPLWWLALGVGELGHGLAGVALLAAVLLGWQARRVERPVEVLGPAAVLVVAALLLARPMFSAVQVAARLPERLGTAFGGESPAGPVLAWVPPRVGDGEAIEPRSYAFAGGEAARPLTLDLYRDGRAGALPVVVAIHGGGWDSGDRRQFSRDHRWLAAQGYAVVAVEYRLAPAHAWPAQREDVLAAIRWIKQEAAGLGMDPQRLVLLGRSAGGQIATAVAYGAADPAIRGVVALYAPHDLYFVWSIASETGVLDSVRLMRQYLGGGPEGERRARYDSGSAQRLVERGRTPPTLLLHGTLDELVWAEHSRRLVRELRAHQVPALLVELPWATHGFDAVRWGPGAQLSRYALRHFLRVVMAPADAQPLQGKRPDPASPADPDSQLRKD